MIDAFSNSDEFFPHQTIDAFGVPSNLMGVHPEEFFSLLGRIVALAALVEHNVRIFYESVVGATQEESGQLSFKKLVGRCRTGLEVLPSATDRELAGAFLSEAEMAVLERHRYAHSLWPAQGRDDLFGWKRARGTSAIHVEVKSTTLTEMRADVRRLVAVLDLNRWQRLLALSSRGTDLPTDAGDP